MELFYQFIDKLKQMDIMSDLNDLDGYNKAKDDASDILDDIIDARIEEARKHNRI